MQLFKVFGEVALRGGAAVAAELKGVERAAHGASDALEETKRKADELPDRKTIRVEVETDHFRGAVAALGPAIMPVLASVGAAIGGMGLAFATAGAGAASFAAIAVPSLGKIFDASKQIEKINQKLAEADTAKERKKALQELAQVYDGLTGKQREALKALQSFKSFWDGFVKSLQNPVLDVFINGLKSLQGALTTLKPMFQSSIQAVADVFNKLNQTMKGADMQRFVQWLNTNAGAAVRAFGDIFINVMRGVINILMAFSPVAKDMEGGLVQLSQRFADWSAGLANSQGFKQFIAYVQQNGPKLMNILGQIVELFINITKAMAPFGPVVLNVVSGILSLLNYLLELHPAVGMVIVGITQMIGTFKLVNTGVNAFKGIISTVKSIGPALQQVGNWIKSLGPIMMQLANGAIRGLIMGFRGIVTALNFLRVAFLTNPFGLIVTAIVAVIAIVALLITHWSQVKAFLIACWNAIKAAAQAVWGWMRPYLVALWNGIKAAATAVWNAIKAGLVAIWNGIKSAASAAFNAAKSVITSVWNAVRSATTSVWNGIKSAVLAVWNALKSSASAVFNAAKSIITTVWNSIKSTTSSVWNGIKSLISSVWNGIKSFVTSAVNGIKSTITNIWNGIKSITSSVWNSIKGAISSGLTAAWNWIKGFAGNFLSAGKGLLDAFVDGIKSGISKAISAVKSGMQAIRNFLPFSPAKEGPLSDLDKSGESFFPTFASRMDKGVGPAVSQVRRGMEYIKNELQQRQTQTFAQRRAAFMQTQRPVATAMPGIMIKEMNVRDKQDIERVARKFYQLMRQRQRGPGGVTV